MSDEMNVILLLDLAKENQVTEAWVRDQDPALSDAPPAIRLTEFGIERTGIGTPDNWLPITAAIERMLARARKHEESATPHYWVAGKAGLPAYFYLGNRLSRQARVTLVNRDDRTGRVDILPLSPHAPFSPTTPYFERSPASWPPPRDGTTLPVGLLVSSLHNVDITEEIKNSLSSRDEHLAAVLGAYSARSLDRTTWGSAVAELDEIARDVHHAYPKREALAVFVAGPATLAFLAGRALNRNIFPNVRVFQRSQAQQYELAYTIGYRREKHTILFLSANPSSTHRLELDEELRAVEQELRHSEHRSRFQLKAKLAPRSGELLTHLRDLKPTILHFSGHGGSNGVLFATEAGDSQVLSGAHIAKALEATRCVVKVVILNACYTKPQAAELLAHVDCVVAMPGKIPDTAAKAFAIGFYGGLGARESVQAAFNQGLARIVLERAGAQPGPRDVIPDDLPGSSRNEHGDPELLVRAGVDPHKIILAEAGSSERE